MPRPLDWQLPKVTFRTAQVFRGDTPPDAEYIIRRWEPTTEVGLQEGTHQIWYMTYQASLDLAQQTNGLVSGAYLAAATHKELGLEHCHTGCLVCMLTVPYLEEDEETWLQWQPVSLVAMQDFALKPYLELFLFQEENSVQSVSQ